MRRDIFRFIAMSLALTIIIAFTVYASEIRENTTDAQKKEFRQKVNMARTESKKLLNIEPNDVESMKIIFWDSESERVHRAIREKTIDKETIAGLLTLCKKAKPVSDPMPINYYILRYFDYILQVKLKNGDSIEIPYLTDFGLPFGNFQSGALKEALYSLTDTMTGHIIFFNQGKVIETIEFGAETRPGEGPPISRDLIYYTSIHINKEGQIILDLKIIKNGKEIINDIRPVKYGDVLSYDYGGQGYLILDIFNPSFKRG